MTRLDQKVTEQVVDLNRSSVVKLIKQGKVRVNGKPVTKAGYNLVAEDRVVVDYAPSDQKIPRIDVPILYEDDDCVVINKPAGLLTHSKGSFNPESTVATWLQPKLQNLGGDRAGIVHRLDRATSGVMICAKTPEALKWLQKQFSQRKVKKTYVAIVSGNVEPAEAVIDMPIERNPKAPATFRAGANGKPATTRYKTLESNGKCCMLELQPTTGRTHQLRVHLKQIGHPIVGDILYDGEPAERLFLHAISLELVLPSRKSSVFEAPLPKEFESFIKGNRV